MDMLERDNDSRLNIYFLGSGTQDIVGVSPGDSLQNPCGVPGDSVSILSAFCSVSVRLP